MPDPITLMMRSTRPMRPAATALALLLGACGLPPQRSVDIPPPPPLAAEPAAAAAAESPPAESLVIAPPPASASAAPAGTVKPASRPEPRTAERVEGKAAAKPPPPPAPAAAKPAPTLDLDTLEQRLRSTVAIGSFTKLALKNQVDDLLDRFRDHYAGRGGSTPAQLRQTYEQLIQRVHGLLRDGDPALASAILQSREAIWAVLTDPVKFARL